MDSRELGDPGTAAFEVDKYPFYLLNRLVSRYNVVIESRLRTIGIDIPYWRVLMILGQNQPRSIGQIAETAVIPVSTMTRIVQRMAGGNLVRCVPLAADNRVVEVSLTPAGAVKLAEARALPAPVSTQVIDGFTVAEFDALTTSLNRLYDNLGPLVPARSGTGRNGKADVASRE